MNKSLQIMVPKAICSYHSSKKMTPLEKMQEKENRLKQRIQYYNQYNLKQQEDCSTDSQASD